MKKRILSFVVAIALVVGMLPMAAFAAETTTFPDMPDNWATEALQNAVANGLLQGIDGNIAPDANLTRAQMATIVTRAFGTNGQASLTSFTDVESGAWYYDSLAAAVKMGAFKGDGASMNPNANITRQEAFTVLSRLFALSDGDVTKLDAYADKANVADWAKGPMAAMVAAGYVSGADGMLNPQANITRAEFAVVMNNLLKLYVKADTTASAIGGNAILNAAGTMKDFTINGDLIIGDGVAEGDAVLDNVSVTGRVVVRGGGVNSVKFINGTSAEKVVVVKVTGDTRITTDGNTTLANVVVSGESEKVIVTGNVTALTLEANAEAALDSAKVETVTVAGANASLTAGTGTTVNTVNVAEAATGAAVTADKNATIKDVTSSADNVTLAGEGTIEKATVSGDNTKVNTTGTSLTVDKDATGVTQNNQDVAGGSTVTTKPETGTVTPPSGGGDDDGSGGVVSVDVLPAPLVDTAPIPQDLSKFVYNVTANKPVNSSSVSVYFSTNDNAPIPQHYNGAGMLGAWFGVGIPVEDPTGVTTAWGWDTLPENAQFTDIANGGSTSHFEKDGKTYYTFYFKADSVNNNGKGYIVLKTGSDDTAKTTTYSLDFSKVKYSTDVTVKTDAQLTDALANDKIDSIVVEGTLGSTETYTTYKINRPLTIKAHADGATVYGTFTITADDVTMEGLTVYNKGDNAGENSEERNAVNFAGKSITLKNNSFNMTSRATGISNGVSIFPTDDSVNYVIEGNSFTGYKGEDSGYISTGLVIAGNLDYKSFFEKEGTTALPLITVEAFQAYEAGNTFSECKYNISYTDWKNGGVRLYPSPILKATVSAAPFDNVDHDKNINGGKYKATMNSDNEITVTVTEALESFESSNAGQGSGKWIGIFIDTKQNLSKVSYKTDGDFTALTADDIQEAKNAGAENETTLVWWVKAETITENKTITLKTTGADDSYAVTFTLLPITIPAE